MYEGDVFDIKGYTFNTSWMFDKVMFRDNDANVITTLIRDLPITLISPRSVEMTTYLGRFEDKFVLRLLCIKGSIMRVYAYSIHGIQIDVSRPYNRLKVELMIGGNLKVEIFCWPVKPGKIDEMQSF